MRSITTPARFLNRTAAKAEKKPEERTRLLLQAITLLSRAADSSPDDTTVLFNYGYALFLAEKYGEAADKLEKVIAADQRDGQAYFLLAKTQERAGRTEPATAADNQARVIHAGQLCQMAN